MSNQSEEHAIRNALIWLIPALALLIALATISQWLPDPLASYHADQVRLMNDEDVVVCLKFVRTPAQVATCTTEIGLLRQRDRNEGPFY